MSDIKLFKVSNNTVTELSGKSVQIEKSLQSLIEKHLEKFLGVKFLASEYSTGAKHSGRIDTLGIDENNCPVIIEYKRSTNENVINQGLYYTDWLLDHKAEFKLLVMEKYGKELANKIEWSGTRLLCIAGGFTKYDEHAISQIDKNIELIRYKKFEDLLLFELVNTVTVNNVKSESSSTRKVQTVEQLLAKAETDLKDRFDTMKSFIMNLGDDVQFKAMKHYFVFKRLQNFACVEVHPKNNSILLYLKVDPKSVKVEKNFTRDVTGIGHYGTGNLEVRLKSDDDLEKAKVLILKSYEAS